MELIVSRPNAILEDALIIEHGHILDERINHFQNRSAFDTLIETDSQDPAPII